MEVSMDTSPAAALSPLPQSQSQSQQPSSTATSTASYSASPTTSRKRSVQEIDAHATVDPSDKTKSPTYTDKENQENADPSLQSSTRVSPVLEMSHVLIVGGGAKPNDEVPVRNTKEATLGKSVPSPGSTHLSTDAGADTPAAKKRKLSPASKEAKQQEKEAKQLEKETKERQRLEEKAKKKRRREKKKKEAAKEEEKRKKEEEKLKKERAQPKLNAFFAKPKPPVQPSSSAISASPKKSSGGDDTNEPSHEAGTVSDYQRAFPEFFLQSHTKVAPPHVFQRDPEALRLMREKLDASMKSSNNSEEALIQSLDDQAGTSEAVQRQRGLLKEVRMKSLRFGEDVRPPYQGTYSKPLSESSAYKMMRNPFYRGLPETNYDYDSEAEWEEPEEGEELDSEEEEEMSEDGEDDMDGFLDDEEDQVVDGKRRLIVGDLEPVCTGIQWHDQGVKPELKAYRVETISDAVSLPIDPFSTVYWQKPKASEPAQTSGRSALPLLGSGKSKRPFPSELLAEFKQVVDGSDLSKLGLIEILKKRFPKVSKDALKDTLNSVATRVGQKEAEKKWVCK
ncbi:hypothetical protein ANOM_002757 [Aspergillus nomiae NRRL 13137]|uniref:Chromatin assembly factor 1 subunit A n=1 Tax=Aspergillus nomiae NRRL (strain ATCC 15546 / NRRL 13137 / CBS 260.88 / M93) TaxID=1509407 RepID=A0A0L1JA99_ASPN3|nr:uncharacterized protein ANOM_002757 [Aspergillus nomiae NRRL 13137]KNG88716.1 hypothetical protein ANOM_002757 [Aspergillus nomiae NRRL 13137]